MAIICPICKSRATLNNVFGGGKLPRGSENVNGGELPRGSKDEPPSELEFARMSVECPVCYEDFPFTQVLSCGHNVCRTCFDQMSAPPAHAAQFVGVPVFPQILQEQEPPVDEPPVEEPPVVDPPSLPLTQVPHLRMNPRNCVVLSNPSFFHPIRRAPDARYPILEGDTCGHCWRGPALSWVRRACASGSWSKCCLPPTV